MSSCMPQVGLGRVSCGRQQGPMLLERTCPVCRWGTKPPAAARGNLLIHSASPFFHTSRLSTSLDEALYNFLEAFCPPSWQASIRVTCLVHQVVGKWSLMCHDTSNLHHHTFSSPTSPVYYPCESLVSSVSVSLLSIYPA